MPSAIIPSAVVTEVPGRYSPLYAVDRRLVGTLALGAPSFTSATIGAGGSLAAGAYFYKITAVNANGETVVSTEKTATSAASNNTATLVWASLTGATGYRIYRTVVGGLTNTETFLIQVGNVTTYADTGAVTLSNIAMPTFDTTGISSSTNANSVLAFVPRTESITTSLQTPTTPVIELGTNFDIGEFDDLGESKIALTNYDVGPTVISLLTGVPVNITSASVTTFGFNQLQSANIDLVRQFADPNGNVFASMFMCDNILEEFGFSLKAKSVAMENYNLMGFNMMMFRGYFITKAYVVQAGDVAGNSFAITSLLGANEAPVAIPVPTAGQPASYWVQRGCISFMKIERYRSGQGFTLYTESSGAPSAKGIAQYASGPKTLTFFAGDLVLGDVFYLTFASYGSNVVKDDFNNAVNFSVIPTNTVDTSDPIAVSTRLTPFTISAANVPRGQQLDMKMSLKRERAEGIGDVTGVYGPPDAPTVSVTLDVKATDQKLLALLQTGSQLGTGDGGTLAGDFFDPNLMTRNQLVSATPIVATINDPRNAGVVVKTYTIPTAVMKSFDDTASNKAAVTRKFSGVDRVGNISVSYTHP